MSRAKKIKSSLLLLLLAVFIVMPFLGISEYVLRVLILCFLYSILAGSLNLISGITGQVSMGHAAFYAIGAYTSALLSMRAGLPVWLGLPCAALVAGVFALLIGHPSLKLTGGYLAVVTLGFSEVVRLLLINMIDLTNGNIGLSGIPMPEFFGVTLNTNSRYYPYALIITVLALVLLSNIEHCKFGLELRAIKTGEIAAEVAGINVHRSKLIAFTIAGMFAGVAGALYAHLIMYIDPNVFNTDVSTTILAMVVLGGMGNLYGTVIVAFILTILPEALRGFNTYRLLVYGIILVLAMLSKAIDFTQFPLFVRLSGYRKKLRKKLGLAGPAGRG